ncbi:MAG: sodium/proton antiporter, family [Marmoricola sp.]|nr:sodium/proton antiporter, family [Marmoricola sp.]
MSSALYLVAGLAILLAAVLPSTLNRLAISPPMVLLAAGMGMGLLPVGSERMFDPISNHAVVEQVTQFAVLLALMGVGLALDRPLRLRHLRDWRRWSATWRLLFVAMPLSIAGVWLVGWWGIGLAPASALLLGAVLAPTDPVLAGDVQVGGPDVETQEADESDERHEVRFALTSEAGLNDGLAFPFVYAAIYMIEKGTTWTWVPAWVVWDLVGKVVIGFLVGALAGFLLAKLAFRSRRASLRLAEQGEPLLALAALAIAFGAAELLGGYGFIAVFCCAMALRNAERSHDYNAEMHAVVQRLERLLTLLVLLCLGIAMTRGLLDALDWRGVLVGVLMILVLRPLSGLVSLMPFARSGHGMGPRERLVAAFFGVRGVGSLFYLAYAAGQADFPHLRWLWATIAFTIGLSVLVHGMLAKPAMRWLDVNLERIGSPASTARGA